MRSLPSLPSFQRLVDLHGPEVHRYLMSVVGPDDADDCFQETFLSALRAYPRLLPESNLAAWVMTIARHKALDSHRGRKRRPTPSDRVPEEPAADRLPDVDPSLWQGVGRLPAKQRTAVVLRYVNDLAHAEIATVMGCSQDAARRNVHEGVKRLRRERS